MRKVAFRTAQFRVVAATIEMFLAVAIYIFQSQFRSPTYDPVRPYFSGFATILMLGGLALLVQIAYALPTWIAGTLSVLAALPFGVLVYLFLRAASWTGVILYGLLAASVLVATWLPQPRGDTEASLNLSHMALGLIEAATGALMLLAPGIFASPPYAALRGAIRWAGVAGLAGAVALLSPGGASRRAAPAGWARSLAGALLPLLLAYNFARTEQWTGMVAWGIWALVLLAERYTPSVEQDVADDRASATKATLTRVDQVLEAWGWLLAVLVVGLSPLSGHEVVASPVAGHVFVSAVALYNTGMRWALCRPRSLSRRVFWRMVFLSVALGLLLSASGRIGYSVLSSMVLIPGVATYTLGAAAGRRLLILSVAAVFAGALRVELAGGRSVGLALSTGALAAAVLGAGAAVGMRFSREYRQREEDLAGTNARLKQEIRLQALIREVSEAVHGSLDLDDVLRETVRNLGEALGASRSFIRLRQEDGSFRLAEEWTAPGVAPVGVGSVTPRSAVVLSTHDEAVAISDVATDARLESAVPGLRQELLSVGARAVLVAPLRLGHVVLGLIGLHQCDAPRQWTPDEVRFLEAVASQVSVAIAHARTHQDLLASHRKLQQAHEELQALHEEVVAQQEELQAQNEELIQQRNALEAQQEQLQEALASLSRKEQSLRDSEARLAGIVDLAHDAIICVDEAQRIIVFNKRAERIFGYSAAEVMGQPLDVLLPERARDAHRRHVQRFAAEPAVARPVFAHAICRRVDRSGWRWKGTRRWVWKSLGRSSLPLFARGVEIKTPAPGRVSQPSPGAGFRGVTSACPSYCPLRSQSKRTYAGTAVTDPHWRFVVQAAAGRCGSMAPTIGQWLPAGASTASPSTAGSVPGASTRAQSCRTFCVRTPALSRCCGKWSCAGAFSKGGRGGISPGKSVHRRSVWCRSERCAGGCVRFAVSRGLGDSS
ncbi:hypothetical protein caldi_19570 [Caldinitratiruptor microaerophilus]|uniref:PAS domain S-box-containing protein n=1 Tax=Caldinitratiruptor microaerophilus TaxID=671077 RepID=A0AA35CNK7_9FIRM|nr:hypothetical protein caldi_19570 [Caldinitratiruptor microaerophilus]